MVSLVIIFVLLLLVYSLSVSRKKQMEALKEAKPGVQLGVVVEHLDLVLHQRGGVDLGVADTLGRSCP